MTQDTILGTETVKAALKTKVNNDFAEYFVTQAEVVAARTSTVKATAYASLDARIEDAESDLDAATGGSGVLVSADDTAVGYLNGKLLGNADILLTEGVGGGDETLTISLKATGQIDELKADLTAVSFFNGIAF